jgi:hypothetical protein
MGQAQVEWRAGVVDRVFQAILSGAGGLCVKLGAIRLL